MEKYVQIYSENFSDIIINTDYLVSLRKKHIKDTLGENDYVFTMVTGEKIYVDRYRFREIKEKLKEMGIYFKD